MPASDQYEVFAVRYGTMTNRTRASNFIMPPDQHDGPGPIDYFVWVIRNAERTIVVDTGFDHEEAGKRGRELMRLPREGLAMLGVDASKVEDVVISHLHYDHTGTNDDFPAARFHIQDLEMRYATGRHMCHGPFGHAYTCEHVTGMVRRLYEGRVQFHDGDEEIAPGIAVHLIGGHTMGVQAVSVNTDRGKVVLASDSVHFYENMQKTAPFPIVYNVADMVAGYDKLRRLASSEDHIVPGHDPLVLKQYPALDGRTEGVIARLDVMPRF
jgi:glyoxylase-like metal-dependent hydrolase (beta-lactamase superfamily II)